MSGRRGGGGGRKESERGGRERGVDNLLFGRESERD